MTQGLPEELKTKIEERQAKLRDLDSQLNFLTIDELCHLAETTKDGFISDRLALRTEKPILGALVKNPNLKKGALEMLARLMDKELWKGIIGHGAISREIVDWMYSKLDQKNEVEILEALMLTPKISPELVIEVVRATPGAWVGDVPQVVIQALMSPALTGDLQNKALDACLSKKAATIVMCMRDDVHPEILDKYAKSLDDTTGNAIREVLDPQVVKAVWGNPNLCPESREIIVKHLAMKLKGGYEHWLMPIMAELDEVEAVKLGSAITLMLEDLMDKDLNWLGPWIKAQPEGAVRQWKKSIQVKLLSNPNKETRIIAAGALGKTGLEDEQEGVNHEKTKVKSRLR